MRNPFKRKSRWQQLVAPAGRLLGRRKAAARAAGVAGAAAAAVAASAAASAARTEQS